MIESFHHIHPSLFTTGDTVEISLDLGGKTEVDDFVKVVGEKIGHHLSHISWFQPLVFQRFNITSVLNGGNRRGVGGRSADALGFQFFYQAGFAVARWWFGKKLFRIQIFQRKSLSLLNPGQKKILFSQNGLGIAGGIHVDFEKSWKENLLTLGFKLTFRFFSGIDAESRTRDFGGFHLGCQGPFPDQAVKPPLVPFKMRDHLIWVNFQVDWTDRFVSFLSVFGAVPERSWFLQSEFISEAFFDHFVGHRQCFFRESH